MILPTSIFRRYDIRGVYPEEINEAAALHIGRGFGTFFNSKGIKNIVVGRDNRLSSPSVAKNFIEGVLSTGCNVTFIDITLTPVIHFLTCTGSFDAGIMVTASHNPANFNGFRVDYKNAVPLHGTDLKQIESIITKEDYIEGEGLLLEQDLNYLYTDFLKTKFPNLAKLKVVIDTGNGAASVIAPKFFTELGCEVIGSNTDIAGGFKLGIPDPEDPLMMERVSKEVLDSGAETGFAFDEDADRFGLVDSQGLHYGSDKVLMLFAKNELERKKGVIVFDVKSSQTLYNFIQSEGGVPKMIRTGHPFFVEETGKGAILGAEFSGHFYFANDYYGFDDGLYAACKVLEILSKTKRPLSNLMEEFPKTYHTGEIKVTCDDASKYSILETLTKTVGNMSSGYQRFVALDGLRVNITDTGWFLIRASNTSPYLSIRLEGENLSVTKLLQEKVFQMLDPFGLTDSHLVLESKIFYS